MEYRVVGCRFGAVTVEAESEEEALERAKQTDVGQVRWLGKEDGYPVFLAAYAERETGESRTGSSLSVTDHP